MKIGTFSLLGIIFIVLKLCGTIGWSWWLVLVPFWGPTAILILLIMFVAFCGAAVEIINDK